MTFGPTRARGIAQDCGPRLTPLMQRLLDGLDVDAGAFRSAAFAYFDTTDTADPYFNNIGRLALPFPKTPLEQLQLLDLAITILLEYEAESGRRLHKGSGYYFAAVRDIVLGDLDRGFMFMHQALVEDVTTYGAMEHTPARAFVTLDSAKQDQLFRQEVERYALFVDDRLTGYRDSGRGSLTLPGLRAKLTGNADLVGPLFSLAYVIARTSRLERPIGRFARDNVLARQLFADAAFDLCRVIEHLLALRFPSAGKFLMLGTEYSREVGCGLLQQHLQDANVAFGKDFGATMAALLDGSYTMPTGMRRADLAADLLVAYGVRNHVAHGLGSEALLADRFEEIEPRLYWVVFSIVEGLF